MPRRSLTVKVDEPRLIVYEMQVMREWSHNSKFAKSLFVAAVLPVIAFELAGYYYGFLLVFAFLWPRRRWIGLALASLAMLSSIPPLLCTNTDDIYVAESVLAVVFVVGVTLALAAERPAAGPVDSSLNAAAT